MRPVGPRSRKIRPSLKVKAQADPAIASGGSKSVLEVLVTEEIFDRPEQPQAEPVVFYRERITRRQVAPPIPLEPIDVLAERRTAEDRREIRARG